MTIKIKPRPKLPEDTSHLGGTATMGRRGQTIYAGPQVEAGKPGAIKATDLSRVPAANQAQALSKAAIKAMHRIAGLVRRGDYDRASKVTMMAAKMIGTVREIAAVVEAQEPQALKDLPLSTRLPSRTKRPTRAGYGAKPGFGTKQGKAWKVNK